MDLPSLVSKSRACRRYDQSHAVSAEILRAIVDCARLAPTGGNMQTLRYVCVRSPEWCNKVFGTIAWAGYLPDWGGPKEGERPTAYVVVANDTSLRKVTPEIDVGIAAQTILLAAVEQGLAGCMLGSVKRDRLKAILELGEGLEVMLVIAIGRPVEAVVVEPVGPSGSVKYYRDEHGVHHVPKRSLEDVLLRVL